MANAVPPPGGDNLTWAQRFQLFWGYVQSLINSDLPGTADAYGWLHGLFDALP